MSQSVHSDTRQDALQRRIRSLREKLETANLGTEESYLTNRAIIMLEMELASID